MAFVGGGQGGGGPSSSNTGGMTNGNNGGAQNGGDIQILHQDDNKITLIVIKSFPELSLHHLLHRKSLQNN